MPDRSREELEALLSKIDGQEGQFERSGAIRAKLADMGPDDDGPEDTDT